MRLATRSNPLAHKRRSARSTALALCAAAALACCGARAAGLCAAESGPRAPVVVELYTSEGCNSCPPADRWLSGLVHRADVVALAFHVDYWDRLGWKDRFASPQYTQRQVQTMRSSGARFAYTPQVLAEGLDWRRWPELPAAAPSRIDLKLERQGPQVLASIAPRPEAPPRLAGYWALVEDGHVSAVKSGENAGVTLHHDAVVRQLRPVAAFSGARSLAFDLPAPAEGQAQRVVLVLTDAATDRPVQSLALACPG